MASSNSEATAVERVSALAPAYKAGKSGILGPDGNAGVVLEDVPNLVLFQVATWADSADQVQAVLKKSTGAVAPGPCRAEHGKDCAVLRIEPMKWWVFGAGGPELSAEQGATLDLSHSRTHIRISGDNAVDFLNRFLPLDFREQSFPVNSVASSVIHHVGVTVWRSSDGYEMFIPRGFTLTLWEAFVEVAEQFGLEVK